MDDQNPPTIIRYGDHVPRFHIRKLRNQPAIPHLLISLPDVFQSGIVLLEILYDKIELK
jgi:hypothetical protein